MQIINKLY